MDYEKETSDSGVADFLWRSLLVAAMDEENDSLKESVEKYAIIGAFAESEFEQLSLRDKDVALMALFTAGIFSWKRGKIEAGAEYFSRMARLGLRIFSEGSVALKAAVLQAHLNTALPMMQARNARGVLACCQPVATRAIEDLSRLGSEALGALLDTLLVIGEARERLNDDGALNSFLSAMDVGTSYARDLDARGMSALVKAGVLAAEAYRARGQWEAALRVLDASWQRGVDIFDRLTDEGRDMTLRAKLKAGNIKSGQGNFVGALEEYGVALDHGCSRLKDLDREGMTTLLNIQFNAGRNELMKSNISTVEARKQFEGVLALARGRYLQLNDSGRVCELAARLFLGGEARWRGRAGHVQLFQVIWLAALTPVRNFSQQLDAWSDFARLTLPKVVLGEVMEAARWWLSDLKAYPSMPGNARQSEHVIAIAQGLAALKAQERSRVQADLLQVVIQPITTVSSGELRGRLFRWVYAMAGDPGAFAPIDGSAAMVLAQIRTTVADTAAWPTAAPWQADGEGLYEFLRIGSIHGVASDDTLRTDLIHAPYAWFGDAKNSRLRPWVFGESANRWSPEILLAFKAWKSGNLTPIRSLLNNAWQDLNCILDEGGAGRGLMASMNVFETPDARPLLLDSLIFGDTKEVFKREFDRWFDEKTSLTSPHGGHVLNSMLLELLHAAQITGNPILKSYPLLEQLQFFARDHKRATRDRTPEERWHLLELGRFALASATLKRGKMASTDDMARFEDRVRMALEREQLRLRDRLGKPGSDGNGKDCENRTFEPFDVLVSYFTQSGYLLEIAAPDAASQRLRDGELLIQLWFDASGRAHLMTLSRMNGSTDLRDAALNEKLDIVYWEELLQNWEAAQEESCAWDDVKSDRVDLRSESYRLAWDFFVRADSPASRLVDILEQLRRASPRGPQSALSIILPADLARLPWLARAVPGVEGEAPDIRAGDWVLESSVSAWLAGRHRDASEHERPESPAIMFTDENFKVGGIDVPFARLEAQAVARLIGGQARVADGIVELARALADFGPTHLILHGKFSPFAPMQSFLSLDGSSVTFPIWLLQDAQVQGDISLTSCESMLIKSGEGDMAWDSPVGIGPLLRARGARSVVGPLEKIDPLASLIFYQAWFEARKTMRASKALAHAQGRLRSTSIEDVRRIASETEDALTRNVIIQSLDSVIGDGSALPFANPAFWAQFTLIGDAPSLKGPTSRVRISARSPFSLIGWCMRLFRGTARSKTR